MSRSVLFHFFGPIFNVKDIKNDPDKKELYNPVDLEPVNLIM